MDVLLDTESDSENEELDQPNQPRRRPVRLKVRKNEKGETQLHLACISGNLAFVKRLVEQVRPITNQETSINANLETSSTFFCIVTWVLHIFTCIFVYQGIPQSYTNVVCIINFKNVFVHTTRKQNTERESTDIACSCLFLPVHGL
jgi:23S rRNA A1618 N6-methylase RlmF